MVVLLQLVTYGPAQLRNSRHRSILGVVSLHRLYSGGRYVFRWRKIRFADIQLYDVLPLSVQLGNAGGQFDGDSGSNALRAF